MIRGGARPALDVGVLENRFVRLEPLREDHVAGLIAAAAEAPGEYALAPVPLGADGMREYVGRARSEASTRRCVPFAIVRRAFGSDGGGDRVVGCTRLMSLEWWTWPDVPLLIAGEPRIERSGAAPDVAEIGHVWLSASAMRTETNTASCLLLMTHAFETWHVHRLTLKTDARNQRSRQAIARLGGRFEGILRSHSPAADGIIRDTAFFSILPAEWPSLKARLTSRLESTPANAQNGSP